MLTPATLGWYSGTIFGSLPAPQMLQLLRAERDIPMEPLTTAELRALHALARYETATEAAKAAGLSPQTLRNQAYRAFKKLGVNGRVEAFRKLGWLRPPRFLPSRDDPDPYRSGFEEEEATPRRLPA